MKITTFLLLIGCLHANADTYGQKVTLSERNVSLERIISLLKQQTDYDFLYGTDLKADGRKVNIEAKNQELSVVLNRLFGDQSFTYTISDKTVVINSQKYSNDDRDQQRTIQAKVLDENRKPLQSATVRVEGVPSNYQIETDLEGMFTLNNVFTDATLRISYMGYDTQTIKVSTIKGFLEIIMRKTENKLEEANVLATGYYNLPKERATGSFEYVDNELFNRNVGPDVISRLKGTTTGTLFDIKSRFYTPVAASSNTVANGRKINSLNTFTMRGVSTLDLNSTLNAGTPGMFPLVILDNFPYEGDMNNINPNDVESVTLLRDAAAASIWGSRSANGVLVITTKKGTLDQPVRISFNNNITIRERPNLFYIPAMNSSDFIDVERFNFDRGVYDRLLSDTMRGYVSPVVELLAKQRSLAPNDALGRESIDQQIDAYRNYDSRKDISKYLYRNAILQQYSMNISGGGRQFSYYVSGGYDYNRDNEVNVYYKRKNLRNSFTFTPLKNLEVSSNLYYNNSLYHSPSVLERPQGVLNHLSLEPYLRLADNEGNPLELINPLDMIQSLKHTYRKNAGNGRLLDWTYYPLNDIKTNYSESDAHEILLNLSGSYKILSGLGAQINYQFSRNNETTTHFSSRNSYYMREFINRFAIYDKDDLNAPAIFQIPIGDGFSQQNINRISYMLRGQLNFDHTFKDVHQVNLLVGGEKSEAKIFGPPFILTLLGYNNDPMSLNPIAYNTDLQVLNGFSTQRIAPPLAIQPSYFNRTTSVFINAAYSFNKRYFVTASGRNDAGNIFGVEASQRIKPNWSVGGAWNVSEEEFFHKNILEKLKIRATFGYLGNVNNSVSAYPTISYVNTPNDATGLGYATVGAPPNPGLSPERSKIINLGVDFSFKENRLSGTIEWYYKNSSKLIAPTPVPLSSGFQELYFNSGSLLTKGFDLNLQSINVQGKQFRWVSNLLLSYTNTLVSKYLLPNSNDSFWYIPTSTGQVRSSYREGYAPFSLFTYKFAGLDPQNGDPIGYDLYGNLTKNYSDIQNSTFDDLEYHGSILPLYFGAFRNTFTWKSLSLSANILFKLKYKIIRPFPLNTLGLSSSDTKPAAEYTDRWQKPGDEDRTNVPSMVYPGDFFRDAFYAQSSARVVSGDHIRLEDIRVDYRFPIINKVFRSMQIYCNLNNLGIIWRANKFGLDPDRFLSPPAQKTVTIGINATF